MTKPTTPGIAELLDALTDAYNHLDDMRFVNEKINIGDYVADLEAQRDEALKDAGRLDFLEDKDRCYWVDVQRQPDGMMMYAGQGPGLREAIDAAIAQRGGRALDKRKHKRTM